MLYDKCTNTNQFGTKQIQRITGAENYIYQNQKQQKTLLTTKPAQSIVSYSSNGRIGAAVVAFHYNLWGRGGGGRGVDKAMPPEFKSEALTYYSVLRFSALFNVLPWLVKLYVYNTLIFNIRRDRMSCSLSASERQLHNRNG